MHNCGAGETKLVATPMVLDKIVEETVGIDAVSKRLNFEIDTKPRAPNAYTKA